MKIYSSTPMYMNVNNKTSHSYMQKTTNPSFQANPITTTVVKNKKSLSVVTALLSAVGLTSIANNLQTQAMNFKAQNYKNEMLKTIEQKLTEIENKRENDVELRKGSYVKDLYTKEDTKRISSFRDILDYNLDTQKKLVIEVKTQIDEKPAKEIFDNKDEYNSKINDLDTRLNEFKNEYEVINKQCIEIENAGYEKYVEQRKKMDAGEELIYKYDKLDKEYNKLDKERYDRIESPELTKLRNKMDKCEKEFQDITHEYCNYYQYTLLSNVKDKYDSLIKSMKMTITSDNQEIKDLIAKYKEQCDREIAEINQKAKDLREKKEKKENEVYKLRQEIGHIEYTIRHNKEVRMDKLKEDMKTLSQKIKNELGCSVEHHPKNLESLKNSYSRVSVYEKNIPSWITTTKGERPYSKYVSLYGGGSYERTFTYMPGSSAFEDERVVTERYSYLAARYLIN